jgi:surface antigen
MLRKTALAKTLGVFVVACVLAPAQAGNLMFLKDSAISKMSDADVDLMNDTATQALDNAADGEARRWANAETGAKGVLTPLATFDADGGVCRKLEIFNEVKGTVGRSVFDFCRQPDGSWKIPAEAPAAPAAPK